MSRTPVDAAWLQEATAPPPPYTRRERSESSDTVSLRRGRREWNEQMGEWQRQARARRARLEAHERDAEMEEREREGSSGVEDELNTAGPVTTLADLRIHMNTSYVKFSGLRDPQQALGEEAYGLFRDVVASGRGEATVHPDLRSEMESRSSKRWLDMACARVGKDDLALVLQPEELHGAMEIVERSNSCDVGDFGAPAWNYDVHTCILQLAVKPFSAYIGQINMSTARIPHRFCPHIPEHRLDTTMIDFGLYLRHESPFWTGLLEYAWLMKPSTFPEFHNANHATISPARLNPLTVSIVTNPAGSGNAEAKAQLALWASAHLTRLDEIVLGRQQRQPLPTLPLISVVGSRWYLYLIRRDDGHDTLFGEHFLGDTESLVGILTLVASLRRVVKWVYKVFVTWFIRHALKIPPGA